MAVSNCLCATTSRNASWAIGLLCVLMVGCSGEKTPTETVAPPPLEKVATPQDIPSEPPGSMEMPDGEMPGDAVAPASNAQSPSPTGGIEMPPSNSGTSNPSSVIDVQFASWQEVEKIAKTSGKVTIVDIWSTACTPCIEELPGLVQIHKTLGDKVHCVTLDIDFYGSKRRPPEFFRDDVVQVITTVGATCSNYICTSPDKDVYTQTEIDSIPAVLVYDASGKLVKKFVDSGEGVGFTYQKDIAPFVKGLLK